MAVSLNHTIIPARKKAASAAFLAKILGLPVGKPFGPFVPLHIGESLSLDFADVDFAHRGITNITPHHYAFQVGDAEFDEIFNRIVEAGLDYYAEPHEPHRYGEINTWRGGRAVYFDDPDGHIMEILTVPKLTNRGQSPLPITAAGPELLQKARACWRTAGMTSVVVTNPALRSS